MKRIFLSLLIVVAFPVMVSAQTYYRPYYQERPLVDSEVPSYPYFLENRTGSSLTVYLYVDKVRWEFVISPDNEVSVVMLPYGAKISTEGFADVESNKGRKQKKVHRAYYFRGNYKGKVERGWVFYR